MLEKIFWLSNTLRASSGTPVRRAEGAHDLVPGLGADFGRQGQPSFPGSHVITPGLGRLGRVPEHRTILRPGRGIFGSEKPFGSRANMWPVATPRGWVRANAG